MVKHVILWTLKDEFSESEKETIKKDMKEALEGLMGNPADRHHRLADWHCHRHPDRRGACLKNSPGGYFGEPF